MICFKAFESCSYTFSFVHVHMTSLSFVVYRMIVGVPMGNRVQPLMAPIMTPFSKYLVRKREIGMIGSVEAMSVQYLTRSADRMISVTDNIPSPPEDTDVLFAIGT